MSGTKVCKKCGEEKSLSEFYKHKSNKDGFLNECKKCIGVMRSEYYYENADIIKQRNQNYRESHREERSIREANYRVDHNEEIKEKDRQRYIRLPTKRSNGIKYYSLNREDILKIRAEYQKTPEGKAVMARVGHKRRSKDRKIENTLTLKQWNKILEMQNNKCADCGREFNKSLVPHRDHIIPLSNPACPGLTFGNVQALCHSCNCKKNNRVDFMKAIDNLLIQE